MVLGIVGGVGPEATNKFCEMIIKKKKKSCDQDNIPFIHFCNPKIPDRTEYIMGKGEDPVPEIVKTCHLLESMNVKMLVIPCNTAHVFFDRIQSQVSTPIVNMVDLLIKEIRGKQPPITKVGVLATSGSIHSNLFRNYLSKSGIEAVYPSSEDQESLVMEAIYGKNGIKAGKKRLPQKLLSEAVNNLISQGAEAIILGCTELPLVLRTSHFPIPLYDSMDITAKRIVEYLDIAQEMIEEEAETVFHQNFKYDYFPTKIIEEKI
ncbi:MAG: aspartate racemase [Patescibacteria group bacterium]|jgi:aspartate racemase